MDDWFDRPIHPPGSWLRALLPHHPASSLRGRNTEQAHTGTGEGKDSPPTLPGSWCPAGAEGGAGRREPQWVWGRVQALWTGL